MSSVAGKRTLRESARAKRRAAASGKEVGERLRQSFLSALSLPPAQVVAGYYDRTLAALRAGGDILAIGAVYAAQRMDSIPEEASDQRLDWVVTEEGATGTGRVAACRVAT